MEKEHICIPPGRKMPDSPTGRMQVGPCLSSNLRDTHFLRELTYGALRLNKRPKKQGDKGTCLPCCSSGPQQGLLLCCVAHLQLRVKIAGNRPEYFLTIFACISFYSVGNENGKVRNGGIRSVKYSPSKTDKSEQKCLGIDRQTVI
jgi:hypothetical protein